jgi:hypothetical protein
VSSCPTGREGDRERERGGGGKKNMTHGSHLGIEDDIDYEWVRENWI